tara:strand:+ start:741 stop:1325 length:585 start_codon:yes stop_codon:yes gene_type:complete
MSHLQLAEGASMTDSYIRIPAQFANTGETQYIREDFFDTLPDSTFGLVMGALDNEQLSEGIYLQDKAAREARRAARKSKKADKQAQKARRREAGTKKREAAADYKEKQSSGVEGYEKGKGLKAVMDTVGNIFGGGGQKQLTYDIDYDQDTGFDYSAGLTGDTAQWIKGIPNWAVIAGGLAVVGGTIFLITKKKK